MKREIQSVQNVYNKKLQDVNKANKERETKNPVLAFGDALYEGVASLEQFRKRSCIDMSSEKNKETVKRLLKRNRVEDQMEIGRLAARGLFEKWNNER